MEFFVSDDSIRHGMSRHVFCCRLPVLAGGELQGWSAVTSDLSLRVVSVPGLVVALFEALHAVQCAAMTVFRS